MNPPLPVVIPVLLAQRQERRPDPPPLYVYRGQTIALLRRYYRLSFAVGRLPSLLGREVFPSKLSRHRAPSFEDAVIFVHDVERCLARLDGVSQMLIARIVLQDYTECEVAADLAGPHRQVTHRFHHALDKLSQLLLEAGLIAEKTCQAPKSVENTPTEWKQEE